jgi:hypothetical protein
MTKVTIVAIVAVLLPTLIAGLFAYFAYWLEGSRSENGKPGRHSTISLTLPRR